MAALSLLNYITSFCFLYLSVDCKTAPQTTDEDTFQPLCSRSCNRSSEEPRYHCSCSRSCAVYGDCCYDSPYITTSREKFDFVCLSVSGRGHYKAVSSCPPDQRSDFCQDSLGYQPPVTSKVTNITYGNVFCAACNGDGEKYLPWNVELRCGSENELSSDKTRIVYDSGEFWKLNEMDGTQGRCKFYVHYDDFDLLDSLELRPCTTVRKISRCSPTWNDLSVMEKCRSYADPIYIQDTVFRNSHCIECNYLNRRYAECVPLRLRIMLQNGVIDPSVVHTCMTSTPEFCNFVLGKGIEYRLSSLMNIREEKCLPPRGRRCCRGERYNFREQRCRKIRRG